MKSWAVTSAIAGIAFAWIAYVLMWRIELHSEGEEGKHELGSGRMFDEIAPRYDMINKVISLGLDMQWRRKMIEGLELRAGDRVVDLATGTADVAILIAGELATLEGSVDSGTAISGKSGLPVIGIDPSGRMLDVGRKKAADAGLSSSRVQLQIGDAQDLVDIPDGSVDKVTMAFGIRNVPNRAGALREIRRIIAAPEPPKLSGKEDHLSSSNSDKEASASSKDASTEQKEGRPPRGDRGSSVVAILELQRPESGVVALAASTFIRYGAPFLGRMMSGSRAEYNHLKNSILGFPTVAEWVELMAEAGLDVVSHKTMGFGAVHLYLARPSVNCDIRFP